MSDGPWGRLRTGSVLAGITHTGIDDHVRDLARCSSLSASGRSAMGSRLRRGSVLAGGALGAFAVIAIHHEEHPDHQDRAHHEHQPRGPAEYTDDSGTHQKTYQQHAADHVLHVAHHSPFDRRGTPLFNLRSQRLRGTPRGASASLDGGSVNYDSMS